MLRVGQNHIYTVYIQCLWQGNHQIYSHIWCEYTVMANSNYAGNCLVPTLRAIRMHTILYLMC